MADTHLRGSLLADPDLVITVHSMAQITEGHALERALEARRLDIEDALESARSELEDLRQRETYLLSIISQAEEALGKDVDERLTLHEAMVRVLQERSGDWISTRDLADEINRRELYRKRDGSPVESNQIHARAKNYEHLFEKSQQQVRLRGDEPEKPSGRPRTSRYDPLRRFLEEQANPAPTITFEELQDLVGELPRSAWDHPAWWANQQSGSHVQAFAWMDAGFRVERVDQNEGWVRFRRNRDDDDGTAEVR